MGAEMQRNRNYTGIVSLLYLAVVVITVLSLSTLRFSDSLLRFGVTLLAVLAAESAVYGFAVFWLRKARTGRRSSPVLISGACITAAYAAAAFISAALLDWVLGLHPFWYAAEQLALLIIWAALLTVVGLYGRNAADDEQKSADATRVHRRHQAELQDIRELARSWRHPGAERLSELVSGLEEQFRYSDPVSAPGLYAAEDLLTQKISLLHDQVALLMSLQDPGSDWEGTASELAESIVSTLQQRNRELAALK